MHAVSPYALGATLYVPAVHRDAADIAAGRKLACASSIVLCLEDSLRDAEVEAGLANVRAVLDDLGEGRRGPGRRPLVFVRPRHLAMARTLSGWPGIERIDGFVVPKIRIGAVPAWVELVAGTRLLLMPTLETPEMLDAAAVARFRDELLANHPERMLALRIGGNDLMNCLGLRRGRGMTLYEGPLLYAVSMLVTILAPAGFALTSPVCEIIDDDVRLQAEVQRDVSFGLVGKTAIHPRQVPVIQAALKVTTEEFVTAKEILAADGPAVFKRAGSMCEPATHRNWALRVMERAAHCGVGDEGAGAIRLRATAPQGTAHDTGSVLDAASKPSRPPFLAGIS